MSDPGLLVDPDAVRIYPVPHVLRQPQSRAPRQANIPKSMTDLDCGLSLEDSRAGSHSSSKAVLLSPEDDWSPAKAVSHGPPTGDSVEDSVH